MAVAALLPMAFKADIGPVHDRLTNPEMTISADPRLVSYSVTLSNKLVQDYLVAHPVEKANTSAALTPAEIAAKDVTPLAFKRWSKADVCEEDGNWHAFPEGPDFSGGLGISVDNWNKYGGQKFAPYGAGATPDEQILIAERIQINPPDQNGCVKGGW
jgi:hypothetical protein